ncbi:MAG TPA: hypothetical protein VHM02_14980, partial [Thermoanaerobaculia bacterium]|nr:hypothetical protein [Thermoanaerobaculia bacterium]
PAPALRATLLSMAGPGPEAAALCARSLAPPRPWSADPAAVALPEDQLHADGWSVPELGRDLVPRRWATSPVATLRFDRPLPPGRHTLHLVAHRAPAPRPVEEVCVRPPGAGDESCFAEPAGRFEIALPFNLSRPLRRPEATLRHPLWSPAASLGTGDRRRLTVQLEVAWIDSDPPGP